VLNNDSSGHQNKKTHTDTQKNKKYCFKTTKKHSAKNMFFNVTNQSRGWDNSWMCVTTCYAEWLKTELGAFHYLSQYVYTVLNQHVKPPLLGYDWEGTYNGHYKPNKRPALSITHNQQQQK